MMRGRVIRWSRPKGYGFIRPEEGGANIFVHYTGIVGQGRKDLEEGQEVEYEVASNEKGNIALNVRVLK